MKTIELIPLVNPVEQKASDICHISACTKIWNEMHAGVRSRCSCKQVELRRPLWCRNNVSLVHILCFVVAEDGRDFFNKTLLSIWSGTVRFQFTRCIHSVLREDSKPRPCKLSNSEVKRGTAGGCAEPASCSTNEASNIGDHQVQ